MVIGELVTVADKMGAFDAVKGKLVRQPDPALEKLVIAIQEIYKIYLALEEELTAYLSLWLDEANPELSKARGVLVRMEGGQVQARMELSRGSCTKITNIYERYLRTWFDSTLTHKEAESLRGLFREMAEFDSYMVDAIHAVAEWLTEHAAMTLELVDAGDLAAAQAQVKEARRVIRQDRLVVAKTIRELLQLEADFTEVSGAL